MSEQERPNPDLLLAAIDPPTPEKRTGRLKVFFGAAPGVGKTYAMLEEARKEAMEGREVLIGYAEPHIRHDTELLLMGLDILPSRVVEYRGTAFKEFDLDAALMRKVSLICVDELAHTNAPGMRHQKRWQDVFDLLDAGFDVFTTLNVQHLESVNDVVERITGVKVQETLPDEVLDRADEVELIDTTPEELAQRLREGKVYRPDVAERAIRQFFNKGNLTALRAMALRRTAERVDAQMREQRQKAKVRQTWAASERLLVCVGPSPLSARLIRSARRLAASLRCPWMAVCVETPASASAPQAVRDRINAHLNLAHQLGAEVVTLSGENISHVLTDYARDRNVTKIIIGKPQVSRWRERIFGSLVDDLIRMSGDIDVYVIRGNQAPEPERRIATHRHRGDWIGYLAAIGATAASTGVGLLMQRLARLSDANVLMVFILSVVCVSWWCRRTASVTTAVLSVLAFNFFFVDPVYTFTIADPQYMITFLVLLLTGLLISTLVQRTRDQAALFRKRQNATQTVLDFASELSQATDGDGLAQVTAARLGLAFNCDCSVLLRTDAEELRIAGRHGITFTDDAKEEAVARWTLQHGETAGRGTATLPMAAGTYLPIRGREGRSIGVVAIRAARINPAQMNTAQINLAQINLAQINAAHISPAQINLARDPDDLRLLESLILQAATAIERAELSSKSLDAARRYDQEVVRNTLLAAVSHDLRTPLAAITGAASALVEPGLVLPETARGQLAEVILSQSRRMERIVGNLLDVTRIESGQMPLNVQPTHFGRLIRSIVDRLRPRLQSHPLSFNCAPDLADIACDPVTMDQVFTNLLENAIDHTPPTTPIDVEISQDAQNVFVSVSDHGPGLPPGQEHRVFDKFVRFNHESDRRGLGLGLTISKLIVEANGGRIDASNRQGGGATLRSTFPRIGSAADQ